MSTQTSINRLETFCDGVFAIAITLLILEVKIPSHEDLLRTGGLKQYLIQLWPTYFAFVFSFFIIGVYWVNHHYLFKMITHTDHYFSLLTILFLMAIAFLPFPTALLGDYISEHEHSGTTITFYLFTGHFIPALTWNLTWWYASRNKYLIQKNLKPSFVKKLTGIYFSSVIFISLLVFLSQFFPLTCFLIVVAVNLYFMKAPATPEYED